MKKTKGLAVIMLLLICFMAFVACDGGVSLIKSVTLTKLPTKVVYNIGEKFDPTGGQITAVMTKNDEVVVVDITADMCGEVDTTKAGKVDVKIGYLEKSVTFQITVVDPSVKTKSIEVTTKPTKVGYLIGEKFSAAGGKLTVTKTDDTKEIIDLTDAMCGTVSTATAGKVAVTVTYQEKTTTFEITVAAPTVSSIAVSANPTKVEYSVGETFSAVGGKITVSYSNSDIKVIDMTDAMCGTVSTATAGTVTVTVTYETKTATFDITVVTPTVSSIAVTANPTKVSYFVGEAFSAAGGKITATMTYGAAQVIDMTDAMCGTVSTATAGTVTVTVTYETKTATFDITVVTPTVSSIAVTANPTKVSYFVGEEFSALGGKITVTMTDTTTNVIDLTDAMCGTVSTATAGTVTVTVTYETKTATFDITVGKIAPTIATAPTASTIVTYGDALPAITGEAKDGANIVAGAFTLDAGQTLTVANASYNYTFTPTDTTKYTTVTGAATITVVAKALTITGVTATDRVYDGTTVVTLVPGTLAGKVDTDDVSFTLGAASIVNANAETAKAVTYSATLTGTTAGNYTVTSNDVTVNITKADYVMTGVTFVDASKVYNGEVQTIAIGGTALPTGADNIQVTVVYSAGITNVGAQVITATFATTSPNYNAPTAKTATLTITKATAIITTTGVATTYTYTGNSQTVNSGATLNHTEAALAYSNNAFTTVAEGNNKTVTITAAETANYNSATASVTLVVKKADYVMSGVTFVDASKVYNGAEQTIAIGGTALPTGVDGVQVTVVYSAGITNVGSQVITATFATTSPNYNAPTAKTALLTITPKALTITGVTANDRVYDGTTAVTLVPGTLAGKIATDDVSFTLGAGSIVTADVGTAKAVTYTATLTGTTAGNYTVTVNDVKVNIAKATYDMSGVSFVNESKVYNGYNQYIKITGTLPEGVIVDGYGATFKDVGTGTVQVGFAGDTTNYNAIEVKTATLTITPKALTITGVTATDRVYDGTTVVTLTGGIFAGKIETDDVSYTLSAASIADANVGNAKAVTYKATLTGTTAGNYTVTVNDVTVNIAKADYVMTGVTFVDASKVYNGEVQTLAIGGTALPQNVTVGYSAGITNVGSQVITATFATTSTNYNTPTAMTATLTITKADYVMTGVTFVDASKVYNGEVQTLAITGTLPTGVDGVQVTVAYSAGITNVGSQVITATFATTSPNYKAPTAMTATLTIAKATYDMSGVKFVNETKVYNGVNQAIAITGTLPQGVTVKYSGAFKNPFDNKPITATFTGDAINYNAIADMTALLTITAKALTITGVTATDRAYDGTTAVTLTGGTLNGAIDIINFTLSECSIESANVGTAKKVAYKATLTGREKDNYTVTGNDVFVDITAKSIAVVWGETQLPYTANAIAPTATVATGIVGETIALTVTGQKTAIGTGYTATATMTTANANYTLTNTTVAYAIVESELSKAEALAAAKATEINDLNTAKAAYKQTNYSSANWDIITGYYNTAANEINAVTVITNLPGNFVKTFMINSNKVQTIDQEAAIIYDFTPIDNGAAYALKKKAGATLSANLTIPSAYNSIPVTAIDYKAFNGCKELTTVTIPNSVTSIGRQAFFNCSNIAQITVPDSVTNIGKWAFDGTAWLNGKNEGMLYINKVAYIYVGTMPANTSMELNAGTVSISPEALRGCTGLVSITIPGSVKSIGNDAFNGCNTLNTITMQNGVASIDARAFNGCTALTNINIPASLTSIVNNPFMNCINLATITVDGANATYKSVGNCVIEKASNTLVIGCKASVIPADGSVTSIGTSAFDGCANLTSITIPSTVTSIGDYAFQSCIGLTTIAIPNGVVSIGNSAFTMCSLLATVTIAFSVQTIGSDAFTNCGMLKTITCEAASQPSGWNATWNTTTANIVYSGATTAVTNVAELNTALASAKDGDTISLAAGNFATDLTITKSIKFVGAGVASTTITGAIIVSGVDKTVSFEGIKIHRDTTNTNGVITITSNATVNVKDCVIEHKDKDGGFTTNTTGVRMEGANAKLYLVNTIIDVAYYGVGMRNVGQVVDIQGGKITGWAAIMTSAGGLTPKPAVPANNKITANGTTLVGRPIVNNQDYAIIVLQQELHGNAVAFTNCTFDLIDNYGGGTDMGACYAVFDIRSSNNTIKTIGCTMSKPIKYTLSVGGTATPQTALPIDKFVANSFDINMTLPASYAIKIDIGGANEKQNEELNYSPVVKINNQNYYIVANSAQLATAATAAVANDTIILGVGTFADPVVISAPITLIGQGADKTTVTTCTINSSAVVKDVTITNRTNQQ